VWPISDDWTESFRPQSLDHIKGNPKAVAQLRDWARSWQDGRPSKKAVVLIGPPGVGKTSSAIALANDMGWGLVEMNASDQRTGEAIRQVALRASYSNTFTSDGDYLSVSDGGRKLILLDEADNLFGREDKGAIPAIVELIKETRQPVVLIVNDFYGLSRKSSALKTNTLQISYYRPRANETAKILANIARIKGIQANERTLLGIADNANGDIRAAVRDLESLSLGRESLTEEDADLLSGRILRKDMYDLMGAVFRSNDPSGAHRTMSEIDESPDHVLLWLDENMPYEYRQAGELMRGYEKLSRADIFLGRVRRRQYYRFWSYASDLMSFGVSQARQTRPTDSQRFRFPGYLMKMSRSKAVRGLKDGVTAKIAEHCHTSTARARHDILPFIQTMVKENSALRCNLVNTLDLDIEELAFLMDEKIDSPAVKAAMRGEEDVPVAKAKPVEREPGRPEPSKPRPPKGQKSLLQF